MTTATIIRDPIAAYDCMCEAANRLVAKHAARARQTGDSAAAVEAIRTINAQVDAAPTRDLDALESLRDEFSRRRETFDDQTV